MDIMDDIPAGSSDALFRDALDIERPGETFVELPAKTRAGVLVLPPPPSLLRNMKKPLKWWGAEL